MIKYFKNKESFSWVWVLLFSLIISGCELFSSHGFKKAEKVTIRQTEIFLKKRSKLSLQDSLARDEYLLDIISVFDSVFLKMRERSPINKNIPEYDVFIPIFCDSVKVIDFSKMNRKNKRILFEALQIKINKDKEIINQQNKLVVRFSGYPGNAVKDVYEYNTQTELKPHELKD
jgi:hypothetical protein